MSDIKFNCPHCKQSLEASEDMRGETIECPACNKQIKIASAQPLKKIIPHKIQVTTNASNSRPCPFCGGEILQVAIKCKHCGSDLTSNPSQQKTKRSESIGIITLLVPICMVFLAIFWIRNMDDASSKMYGVVPLTVLITSILIAIEASSVGAGNEQDKKAGGSKREGPFTWFFFGIFLWLVAFPMWMHRRASYGLSNYCGRAILIVLILLGAIFTLAFTGNIKMATSDLQVQIQKNMQETFSPDVRISSFSLVHKNGNQYEGLLEVKTGNQIQKMTVDVTYDGKQFTWKVVGGGAESENHERDRSLVTQVSSDNEEQALAKSLCINQLLQIDNAKEQWALKENKYDGTICDPSDISKYIEKGFESLKCPNGGQYEIGVIGVPPKCTISGHEIPNWK